MAQGVGDEHTGGGGDPSGPYLLGHSDRELARLKLQATLIDPITRRFLLDAGIVPGMRVLDVGSGVGDVAFLAAELVGSTGYVLGIDYAPTGLAEARQRATERSPRNVEFREGNASELTFEQPFDAVIGRYFLMFQRNPAAMLRSLRAHVRPLGVIVFHEGDWEATKSFPPAPTYDRCCRWIAESVRLSGAEARMGIKLHATFTEAGLSVPSMRLESVIGGTARSKNGPAGADRVRSFVQIVAEVTYSLLPVIEQFGVASAGEVDIDTLRARICGEIAANGSVIVGRSEIGAWSRA